MAFDDLAQKLFGAKRAESNAVLTDATTGTIHGTALTDSADGAVTIEIDGDVTVPEEIEVDGEVYYGGSGVGIDVPTSENVKAGDEVLVSVYGEGTMRSPAVTSAIGSGDRIAADASAAREIAEATGQHFWDDDSGAHVTELPRDEWEQQQSGPNSLWNSLGMLFRDGLNNLLAIVTGQNPGLQVYDGRGNTDENILAEFSSQSVRLGRGFVGSGLGQSAVEFFDGKTQLHASHDADSTTATNNATVVSETNDADLATGEGYVARTGIGAWSTVSSNNNNEIAAPTVSLSAHAGPELTGKEAELVLSASYDKNASARRTEIIVSAENVLLVSGNGVGKFTMQHVIDMLTTSSTALTRSSATSSWTSGEVKRSGKVVTVTVVSAKLAAALASGSNSAAITTIPYGFRPTMLQRVPCALSANGNYANVWAAIGTGGAIVIANHSAISIPNTSEISLNCTYIID